MELLSETTEKGVTERRFDLTVGTEIVPGIIWSPEDASAPCPTILIGHGGTQHKRAPNVLGLARRFVRHQGWAAVAIDAPGHGDRVTDPAAADAARERLGARLADGQRTGTRGMDPAQLKALAGYAERGVPEWKAVVDALEKVEVVDAGRLGYWGVSMGTVIGLPFVASEPRVRAAVLGLAGTSADRPGSASFVAAARSLTIPILFVFQWDDELMTRESGLELFDAIGSKEKTMHINPGGHVGTPLFERDSYAAFFARHLTA